MGLKLLETLLTDLQTDEDIVRFPCEDCGKTLYEKYSVNEAHQIQTDITCPSCGATYTQ